MNDDLSKAIEAGERAINSLYVAEQNLSKARNWGGFDIALNGRLGVIPWFFKHKNIEQSKIGLEQARSDLAIFTQELEGVAVVSELNIEIGDFVVLADYFFDGLIADLVAQRKIKVAQTKIRDTIKQIESIINRLKFLDSAILD